MSKYFKIIYFIKTDTDPKCLASNFTVWTQQFDKRFSSRIQQIIFIFPRLLRKNE